MRKYLLCFIAFVVMATCGHAETTYKLTRVTTVEDGGMYVFEQSGYVMGNTINNAGSTPALRVVSMPTKTTGLTGNEDYVWTLEKTGDLFYMKNVSNGNYLYVFNTSYHLQWNESKKTKWDFILREDKENTFNIVTKSNDKINNTDINNRHLGYNGMYYYYRTYTYTDGKTTNPGDITVYKLEEENSEDVVVTKVAGLATYVSDYDLDYSEVGGVKVYRAQVTGYDVTFHRVLKVPAGEGVLLRATGVFGEEETNKTFTIPITTGLSAWNDDDNDFIRGNGVAIASESDGYYNFILNVVNTEVGFYRANDQVVASNRAYLRTTTAPAAGSRIGMTYEDEINGISTIDSQPANHRQHVYNIYGMQVGTISEGHLHELKLAKGVYIVDGKKVILR